MNQDAEERFLIEAAQKDPRRFAELYQRHFERVYAFVSRRVCERHDVEDVTADVFHRALANINRFEWRGAPFAAWLFRIAANAIADRRQSNARQQGEPLPEETSGAGSEQIETRAMIFRLVDALPEDQRRVVIKRFVEQKSVREIAQELQKSEGAVKQLQFRALESLRARVGRQNE
ncbi:MAG: sigma-70 family RNA polymerase sigma factor [Acidobacteria bacterium]|nr:sigma-70 family RNA polymerase sigma factor [Acidobacteriota bacterium]